MQRLLTVCITSAALWAQSPASRYDTVPAKTTRSSAKTNKAVKITVPGDHTWLDTGLDLVAGEILKISAAGTVRHAGLKIGPEGIERGWLDMIRPFPVPGAPRGALVGRIGDSKTSRPFLIGRQTQSRIPVAGRLYLGLNQPSSDVAAGEFEVTVERILPNREAAEHKSAEIVPMTEEQLNSVPARVTAQDSTPGDRVNFFIVGNEAQVTSALRSAGWVSVDRSVQDAVLRGILASLSKQAYVTLPMSELYLFGRPQDYGWAMADPLMVVAARHHFRIWKTPFQVGGRTVWAGAGTHDIGFDKDQRNGQLTHKIDPDTDKERDFIGQTLADTGTVAKREYMTLKKPVTKAKTAHGQEFFSDGRTLIIYMENDETDAQDAFSDAFCSVLAQNNPDTGDWGGCERWIQKAGRTDLKLEPLNQQYRILVVPGFMSSCFSDAPAFDGAVTALQQKYDLTVERLQVSNADSATNAKTLANFLEESWKQDQRKWILVGYSKGTPDIQEALAKENISDKVAAFVSVAGASGGSPIAEFLPAQAERWMRDFQLKRCEGELNAGIRSLSRKERQAFLAAFPESPVPTYSIVAASSKESTSKALQQTWMLLNPFDRFHDGQLTRQDAIVPGSKYLGVAKGDHFAVALPFDKSENPLIRSNMDKTRFPRAALLEALLRVVQDDLTKR